MLNEQLSSLADESLVSIMHLLAGYIIDDLNEVQNSGELFALLQHTDPEIQQAAVQIYDELSRFIVDLSQVQLETGML